jgi:hypothetical protein
MQEDAKRAMANRLKSATGLSDASSSSRPNSSALLLSAAAESQVSPNFGFQLPSQTKGWVGKALEFINSGPPALLNNPCCSRRVVIDPFLKHAMEVHYG